MNYRLSPGQSLPWSTRDGSNSVIVTRTDAGQTWTVEWTRGGQPVLDAEGAEMRWTFMAERPAMRKARFIAESLRDLVEVES